MAQLQTMAAWRLFTLNWIPIGVMAVTLSLCLAFTGFSIKPESALIPFGAFALYAGVAYYNACRPHKRDPLVVFILGSTAQLILITLLMTPMTYISAAIALPMQDATLAQFDEALGFDWRGFFSFVYERPQLIAGLALAYRMIALPVFGIPIVLGATRHYRRLQEFSLAFALTLVATTIISVFVPAIGTYDQLGIKLDPAVLTPGGYLDQLRDLPLVRAGALRELDVRTLAGIIAFPSFHAAAAVLYIWAVWSVWWMRPPALIIGGAMLLATPIGGGHYFVDVLAGMAVAALAIVAALRISAWLTAPAGWLPWPAQATPLAE